MKSCASQGTPGRQGLGKELLVVLIKVQRGAISGQFALDWICGWSEVSLDFRAPHGADKSAVSNRQQGAGVQNHIDN